MDFILPNVNLLNICGVRKVVAESIEVTNFFLIEGLGIPSTMQHLQSLIICRSTECFIQNIKMSSDFLIDSIAQTYIKFWDDFHGLINCMTAIIAMCSLGTSHFHTETP